MTTNSKLLVNKDETPSEFLHRIRRERDYTQNQIAKFMGVSQVTVMRWESGQSAISSKSAKGLGEFFNIDPSNFYSSEDPTAKHSVKNGAIWIKPINQETGGDAKHVDG